MTIDKNNEGAWRICENINGYFETKVYYFYTKKEAMKRFGVGKYRLEYLIQDGVVPIIKFGYRTVRIPVKEATESILALARGGDAR